MTTPATPQDIFNMSDEDFAKMGVPPESPASASESQENKQQEQAPVVEEPKVPETPEKQEEEVSSSGSNEEKTSEEEVKEPEKKEENTEGKAEEKKDEKPTPEAGADKKQEEVKAGSEEEAAKTPDYEGFYKQIMTPFKANGKMIELRTPDEAIKLMQMGANYTRRMQELAPHRKLLTVLQNNNIDESKLSFFIDLDKKNPDAIKKLVKDSGIDPLDINVKDEVAYTPTNHGVTDEEVRFKEVLTEMNSTPEGNETLVTINNTWDDVSKEALWKSPELLGVIQEQRQNGIYQQIVAELDRQRTFGKISPNVPFLAAYKQVGDDMMARKAFVMPEPKQEEKKTEPTIVATRTATPKATASNADKARAASPTKTSPNNKAQELVNPLAMSDEDFLKQMQNRL